MTGSLFLALRVIVVLLYLALIGRVLLSWTNPRFDTPVGRVLYRTTEPILGSIRSVLPSTGAIDFSPLVAFLALSVLAAAVGLR